MQIICKWMGERMSEESTILPSDILSPVIWGSIFSYFCCVLLEPCQLHVTWARSIRWTFPVFVFLHSTYHTCDVSKFDFKSELSLSCANTYTYINHHLQFGTAEKHCQNAQGRWERKRPCSLKAGNHFPLLQVRRGLLLQEEMISTCKSKPHLTWIEVYVLFYLVLWTM